jgi:hypothetical protein
MEQNKIKTNIIISIAFYYVLYNTLKEHRFWKTSSKLQWKTSCDNVEINVGLWQLLARSRIRSWDSGIVWGETPSAAGKVGLGYNSCYSTEYKSYIKSITEIKVMLNFAVWILLCECLVVSEARAGAEFILVLVAVLTMTIDWLLHMHQTSFATRNIMSRPLSLKWGNCERTFLINWEANRIWRLTLWAMNLAIPNG